MAKHSAKTSSTHGSVKIRTSASGQFRHVGGGASSKSYSTKGRDSRPATGMIKGGRVAKKPHVFLNGMGKIVTPEANVAMLMTAVEAGFPYHLLSGFSGTTGIPLDVVAATVRIPSRTLSRRKTEGKLQPDESERLLRLSNLVANAVSLFEGDRGAAMDWLRRPQKGLGGGVPLDYAKTEVGARAVEDLIGRLEHGVFT